MEEQAGKKKRTRKTTDEQIAEYEKKMAEAEKKLRELRKKKAADSRKQRNHIVMLLGGMVAQCFDDGIEAIDFQKLDAYLGQYKYAIARCTHDPVGLEEEYRQATEYEKQKRLERLGRTASDESEEPDAREDGKEQPL